MNLGLPPFGGKKSEVKSAETSDLSMKDSRAD